MNEGLIPRRYAKALLKFAEEKSADKRLYGQMLQLEASFKAQPQLQESLTNPYVADADKSKLILLAAGAQATDTVFADFIKLLCNNRRIAMTRDIALAYLLLYREANNIHVVHVQSASKLSSADEARIKELVSRHLDGAQMEYTSDVNPSLIGGFTVSVGNDRIDASVSNELKQLRLNLLSK